MNAEKFTREELEKTRDAFYFGDIGDHTETGFKLLRKDEETINLVGKVVTTLVNNKLKETDQQGALPPQLGEMT